MGATLDRPILGFTQVTKHVLNVIGAMNFSGAKFNQSSDAYIYIYYIYIYIYLYIYIYIFIYYTIL